MNIVWFVVAAAVGFAIPTLLVWISEDAPERLFHRRFPSWTSAVVVFGSLALVIPASDWFSYWPATGLRIGLIGALTVWMWKLIRPHPNVEDRG